MSKLPDDIEIILAKNWSPETTNAYLWVHTGDGELLPIQYITKSYTVVTGIKPWSTRTWFGHANDLIYICPEKSHDELEAVLRDNLRDWRERF